MARRVSLDDFKVDSTNNADIVVRATRSSTRKQNLIDTGMMTPSKPTPAIGTRMVTRKRKVSLSPDELQTPYHKIKSKTPNNAKAALALSKRIQSGSKRAAAATAAAGSTDITAPQKKKAKRFKIGRWEKWEQIEFLKGLREHGRGHWKVIAESIPTRTTVQVKTHAQVELNKLDNGFDIFQELDEYLREEKEEETDVETENLELVVPEDDDEKEKTPKKKTPRKRTPKSKKKTKKQVDPLFILSPVGTTKNDDKTPVVSNKSVGAPLPPTLSYSSSSSLITSTMTTSTFGQYLPNHHLTRSMGGAAFHPMSAAPTGGLPSSYFHFPLRALPRTSLAAPTVHPSQYYGMRNGTAPTGSFFGVYEAASTLLVLATSNKGAGASQARSGSNCA